MTPLHHPRDRHRSRVALAGLVAAAVAAAPLALAGGAAAAPDDAGSTASTSTGTTQAQKPRKNRNIRLDVLAFNDFHGQLDVVPSTSSSGRVNGTPAGGAAYLARHLQQLRKEARRRDAHSITVSPGDLIGATPLLSAAFHDEPTIEVMNALGVELASVGNHEFDEGWRELRRMQRGGCLADGDGAANQNSCPDPAQPFTGADFRYVAANVTFEGSDRRLFPAYRVKRYDGAKVAFVGLTLKETPNIVTRAGVEGLQFRDEVRSVRRLMPELRRKGVRSIVVMLHQGAVPADTTQGNGCPGVAGEAVDIAKRLPGAVDVVLSAHTHYAYNCVVRDPQGKPRLLTQAASLGRIITQVQLQIDRRTKDVVRPRMRARNHIVTNSDFTRPSQAILDIIAKYQELVEPIANEVLGHLAPDGDVNSLEEPAEVTEDFALGNLIADSQLNDPSAVPDGGEEPQIAFMNPGGIRANLSENEDGDITYGAAFSVQPFNNYVTSMTLTGAQVLDVLEEQWNGDNEGDPVVLQVAGLTYTYDTSEAAGTGDAVVEAQLDTDGDGVGDAPLVPGDSYRVVVNSFLADGGDGFPTLAEGADRFFGGLDIDALAAYLAANDPYSPTAEERITVQP